MPRKMMTPSPGVSILSVNTLKRWPRLNATILLSIRRLLDCASDLCASRMHTADVPRRREQRLEYLGGWDSQDGQSRARFSGSVRRGRRRRFESPAILAPAAIQNGVGGG